MPDFRDVAHGQYPDGMRINASLVLSQHLDEGTFLHKINVDIFPDPRRTKDSWTCVEKPST